MPHSQSFEAIVLQTYDVGEADRFCILFTRERGRIAARASGARRLHSRLGGSLLPFRRVAVELKEGSGGWIVCGVSRWSVDHAMGVACNAPTNNIAVFSALEEGIELLLRLVTDEGALPDVFDVTLSFISACQERMEHAPLDTLAAPLRLDSHSLRSRLLPTFAPASVGRKGYGGQAGQAPRATRGDKNIVLSYTFCLLHCLGFLPGEDELEGFSSLGFHERAYLRSSRAGTFHAPHTECDLGRLMTLRSALLIEHLGTPLKTPDIVAMMA